MKQHWVIMYDIADEKRLRQTAKEVEKVATRVQRSVYEAILSRRQITELRKALQKKTDPTQDVVTYVRLCEKDWAKRRAYGVGARIGPVNPKTYRII